MAAVSGSARSPWNRRGSEAAARHENNPKAKVYLSKLPVRKEERLLS
jgi:hypothetical protein